MSEVSQNPHDTNLTERMPHAGMKNVPDDVVERPTHTDATPITHGEAEDVIKATPNTISDMNLTPEEIALLQERRAQMAATADTLTDKEEAENVFAVPTSTEAESKKKTPLWVKIGAGLGLVAAGGIFAATRGDDEATAKPPTASSTPNPGTPTPSATEAPSATTPAPVETGAPGSKDQKEMLRNLNLSASAFPDLSQYELKAVNPSVYRELAGGNGNIGLFPEIQEGLARHELIVQQLKPEQIALKQQGNEYLLDAKYTVVDGDDTKQVGAPEFYGINRGWFAGQNKTGLLFNMNMPFSSKAEEANKVATSLIPSENGVTEAFITRREELSKYKETHANSEGLRISDPLISAKEIVRRMYISTGPQIESEVLDAAVSGKTELSLSPAEGKAYIAESYKLNFKSADGTVNAELPAASVVYKDDASGKYIMDLVVIYPIQDRIKNDSIQNDAEGYFQTALVERVVSKN